MKKTTRDLVYTLATDVRYWAEGKAGKHNQELCGWCAKASAELWRRLHAHNPRMSIKICLASNEWMSHVFLQIEDHIVDVTASQFGEFRGVPVVIEHERELQHVEYFQVEDIFLNPNELIAYQKKTRWPPDQIAYNMPGTIR